MSKELGHMAASGPAATDLSAAIRLSEVVVPRNAKGQVPIFTNDAGERIFAVFSGFESLMLWTKDVAASGTMRGPDAFALAVELQVDFVVIDPVGPVRVEFSVEDARRLASQLAE